MNLQDLRYIVTVAKLRHFGRAAEACNISQPTLSNQIRKLEEELGVVLFERSNRRVDITEIGEQIIAYAERALGETSEMERLAKASQDPLDGPFRLGSIPTLAPYLMPQVWRSLQKQYPKLKLSLWEDTTVSLLEKVRDRRLDAALVATEITEANLTELVLFEEPLIAALPPEHPLAERKSVREAELAKDLLVLADGHCLSNQTLEACGGSRDVDDCWRAASLETLVNLVAAGYGTTLIPALAVPSILKRGVVLKPLQGRSTRTIRLVSRPSFTRPQALRAIEGVVRKATQSRLA